MPKLTLYQLHAIAGGRLRLATLGPRDGEWSGLGRVCTDSRRLQPGEVFWALQGPVHDGGTFVESAFARGASGVVAAKDVQPWPGCWALQVDDGREALYQLARWHRDQFHGRLIMVGGVAGTATTRRLIATVLGSRFAGTCFPQRNHRLDSAALGMLGLEPTHDFAVTGLNLSAPGDAVSLVAECGPAIGVITNVTRARAANTHSSVLHDAAVQLLTHLPQDGHAVLCGDDPGIRAAAEHCTVPITWVGESSNCDLIATRVLSTEGRLSCVVDGQTFHVACWGRHQLTSVLCAIGVGRAFGLSMQQIAVALEGFDSPPPHFDAISVAETAPSAAIAAPIAAPAIIKFQPLSPGRGVIARRVRPKANPFLRFDPAHRFAMGRAA